MTIQALKELFTRDLNRLRLEIESYKEDSTMWKVEKSIKNSGGNLCLHLIGNLKTYIGYGLGEIHYVRNREFEFSGRIDDRGELCKQIDESIKVVNLGLSSINDDQLNDDFPIMIWEEEKSMAFTLIHLHSHLTYHLGQINYHRRMLDEG